MRIPKLFRPFLIISSLWFVCSLTNPVYAVAYAEETSTSEIGNVEESTEEISPSGTETDNWYEANKETINLIINAIVGILSALGGVAIALKPIFTIIAKIKQMLKDNDVTTERITDQTKELVQAVADLNFEFNRVITEVENALQVCSENGEEIKQTLTDLQAIKKSLKVIYTNDEKYVKNGIASSVLTLLNDTANSSAGKVEIMD